MEVVDMAVISNFVIHELKKHEESDIAPDVLDLSEPLVLSLAEDILNVYRNKASVIWGKFRETGDFPKLLPKYDSSYTKKDFFKVSKESMDLLSESISSTSGTGGYICFVEYQSKGDNRLLIAMIKNTDGIKLTDLKPKKDFHVDLSKLYQALDINVSYYLKNIGKTELKQSYIGFISKRGEPSGYFQTAFSCTDNITPSKAVRAAPAALKAFLKEHSQDEKHIKEAEQTLLRYLNERKDKTVHLSRINDIANAYLPDDIRDEAKDAFLKFSKKDQYQLPDSFHASKGTIEGMVRLAYKSEKVSINFEKEELGITGDSASTAKPVIFDPIHNHIIIRDLSEDFIEQIKQQLDLNDD
jgi:nucleoid-associated protein